MNLKDLQEGSAEPGDCRPKLDSLPSWLQRDMFAEGQLFFQKHVQSFVIALHCSLVSGFTLQQLSESLVFTEQSGTAKKAMIRYLTTFAYLLSWHIDDVLNNREGRGYKSLEAVKQMHKNVAKRMPPCEQHPVHVSQYDMALTQCGFMGMVIMYPTKLGIRCSERELTAYVHFWRVIGYMLGIDDRYNICSGDYAQTVAICHDIERHVLIPSMLNPPKEFHALVNPYCNGINRFLGVPLLSQKATFAFVYDVVGIERDSLWGADLLRLWVFKLSVLMLMWCPFFERMLNYIHMRIYNNFAARSPK